jgi:hypothetical protein
LQDIFLVTSFIHTVFIAGSTIDLGFSCHSQRTPRIFVAIASKTELYSTAARINKTLSQDKNVQCFLLHRSNLAKTRRFVKGGEGARTFLFMNKLILNAGLPFPEGTRK